MSKITIKVGNRIEITDINDNFTKLEKGSKGTIFKIDKDQNLIWVNWDNGERLALIDDIDKFKIIKK
jgi:hypothetical protein